MGEEKKKKEGAVNAVLGSTGGARPEEETYGSKREAPE